MRTTVDLPSDLLAVVRALARDQGRSMSAVVTEFVRKGLSSSPPDAAAAGSPETRNGFPLLALPRTITTDDVHRADED